MIPVISVVGQCSNVGKTTLVCSILSELKQRGYRVATIKHNSHSFDIDHPGKDTWQHAHAGADVVAISSKSRLAIIENREQESPLTEIVSRLSAVDIVITEGFRHENTAKIEVYRKNLSHRLLADDPENKVFALVADELPGSHAVPHFHTSESKKLVDLIVKLFLKCYN